MGPVNWGNESMGHIHRINPYPPFKFENGPASKVPYVGGTPSLHLRRANDLVVTLSGVSTDQDAWLLLR
jgi:hypothetical protein